MTSPVAEQSHGSRPRPTWRQRQDARFTDYARARERQLREAAKHSGRIGDRQHVVRPPQPTGRKACNEVVSIPLSRQLTRREHAALSEMLLNVRGVTAINIQGGSILCAVNLMQFHNLGIDRDSCVNMIQEQVDRALE